MAKLNQAPRRQCGFRAFDGMVISCALAVMLSLTAVARARAQAGTPTIATPETLPTDAAVRKILADRIDVQHRGVGMVVGIITPQGRRVISYGRLDQGVPREPDGDTIFEIASISKAFTALLLADMVRRGEVALNDPVARYLPLGVKLPQRNGRSITLVDLATHTSGLPHQPSDVPPPNDAAACAAYTDEKVYQFLSTYRLPRDIGSDVEYSNLGAALLADALARRAGMGYEALVRTRITGPLRMTSTAITLSPEMQARLAAGHDARLKPAFERTKPLFFNVGSLRSSANDLLTFLAAFMRYSESPLTPAMTAMLETRRAGLNSIQALAWTIVPYGPGDDGIVTHHCGAAGHTCTVAFDPKTRIGVVVLSKCSLNVGDIAWHLLRPRYPLSNPLAAKPHKEIAVDPKLFDCYVGKYQPEVGMAFTVERRGNALLIQLPGLPKLRIRPESERGFFNYDIDLRIVFQTDSQDYATGLVVRSSGSETAAQRIGPASGKP